MEDETLISLQIEAVVEGLGCVVVGPVATIEEALACLRRGTPDAAILDVNLAGERSDRVAQALAALDVPFLYCTGYADGPQLVDSGPVERVTKPLDPTLLSAALRRVLAG